MSEDFPSFAKIPRLNKEMVITEKLDGTNGLIEIADDGTVRAGSRSRWLDKGQPDNMGFRAWVEANEGALRASLPPGRHYGEWWGQGIQRRYGLDHKRFTLFNTARYAELELPPILSVVPELYRGPMDTEVIKACVEQLRRTGSVAVPGWMKPEGVVVYHAASGHLYKVLCENDSLPKGLAHEG